ncbi:MAG: HU family DNA-binding protein [Bacteroides sp.]|nr:HU family DNA-binding protein [Bacteroides sp.]
MNKNELVHAVAQKTGLTLDQSTMALDAVIGTMVETVNKGDSIMLVGFGTFSVIERKARNCHNPLTGKNMLLPAKKIIKFKAGNKMKPE